MYILAIETTGPVGSVAVISTDDKDGADSWVPMKITTQTMSHLKNLIPMAAEILEEEHIDKEEICAVAASVGPGSFTGIRIGVSTARALAQAWGVPCISVPTLELFREKCGLSCDDTGINKNANSAEDDKTTANDIETAKDTDGSVCVIFNARRGQVYGACYGLCGSENSGNGEVGKVLIEPGPYMLDEVLAKIDELGIAPVFYGDGVDAYFDKDEFRDRVSGFAAAPESERYQTADMTARYALTVWNRNAAEAGTCEGPAAGKQSGTGEEASAGKSGKVVGFDELLPDYMRESEAEQRLKDGSLEKMRKAKMERFMKMAGKQA